MRIIIRSIAIACSLFALGLLADGIVPSGLLVGEAEARRGRPATPMSYAGVARRTTRRMIVATQTYRASLPQGCSTVVIEGTTLHQCSGTYYQPSGNQYVVVNVN